MAGSRHYPPAYYRYRKQHPIVSVVLTKELKQLLDQERKTEKQSYGELVKQFVEKGCDVLKARQEGYKKARIVKIGVCSKCKKPLSWNLDDPKGVELLIKAVNNAGYIHDGCG